MLVFLMTMADFTVPSVFGFSTYPLDIFAEFGAAHSPGGAFVHALPMVVFSLLAALPAAFLFRRAAFAKRRGGDRLALAPRNRPSAFTAISLGAVFLFAAAVLFSLFAQVSGPTAFLATLASSGRELWHSFMLAFLMAVCGLPVALAAGWVIARGAAGASVLATFAVAASIALPASLTGIAVVGLLGRCAPGLLGTVAAVVLAGVLRTAPYGALVAAGFIGGLDSQQIAAWKLYRRSPADGLLRVVFPLVGGGVLLAALVMLALALSELGATLLLIPPGMNTVTIKIYNYLHYGASDIVAGLCLAMVLIWALIGGVVYSLFAARAFRLRFEPLRERGSSIKRSRREGIANE
jgi:iron(III) transport system permease protein